MGEWRVDGALESAPACMVCRGKATEWAMLDEGFALHPKGGYSEQCAHWYTPWIREVPGGFAAMVKFADTTDVGPTYRTRARAEATALEVAERLTAKLQSVYAQVLAKLLRMGMHPSGLENVHVIALDTEVLRPSSTTPPN